MGKLLVFILPAWWKSYLTTDIFRKNVEWLADQYSFDFKIVKSDSFYQSQGTKKFIETDGFELMKIIENNKHKKITLFFVGLKYFPNIDVQTFLEEVRKRGITCI